MKFEIDFIFPIRIRYIGKNNHKSEYSLKQRLLARQEIKPNCIICGNPVPLGRKKLCSEKCWLIYDKTRNHKKVAINKNYQNENRN